MVTHLKPSITRKVLSNTNTNTLNNSEEHRATNGAVPHRLVTTSHGESTTREKAGNDGIVRILLLPDALDGAVEGREETTPHAEVTAEDGST